MDIIESENYSFDVYKKSIEQTDRFNPREQDYQVCIADFLKGIFKNSNIDVIDVSKDCNTVIHTCESYTGIGGPPDLLLARNYQYKNKNNNGPNAENIAVIEIKVPLNIPQGKLIDKHSEQLKSHLSKTPKVIFTDCTTWCFFINENVDSKGNLKPVQSFKLTDDSDNWTDSGWRNLQCYIKEFVK